MVARGATVGVIGLGAMGSEFLRRLQDRGWRVQGYDSNPAVAGAREVEGLVVRDVEAACRGAEAVVLSLPSAEAVASVVHGEGARAGLVALMAPGATVVDSSTSSPGCAIEAAEALSSRGVHYLDAPVSGGAARAREGKLTMLLAGTDAVVARAQPLIEDLADRVIGLDGIGAAQVAKLLNNLLVATQLVAVSEAIILGRRWGVEPGALLTAVNASSGRSAVSEVNFPRWILNGAFDSGFSMKLMRKDVAAAIALATSETPTGAPDTERHVLLQTAAAMWRDSVARLSDDADFNRMGRLPEDVE